MRLYYYIIREYLRYLIGTLVLCIFLFVLFDFIHKTTRYFPRYEPDALKIFKFYVYMLPSQVVQALPIASLMATVISMAIMARGNELTAMRAIGMGPLQLALPLGIVGLGVSIAGVFVGEVLMPKFSSKMRHLKEVVIEGEKELELAEGTKWIKGMDQMIHFSDYDPINQKMKRVKVISLSSSFRPYRIILADQAVYNESTKTWAMEGVRNLILNDKGEVIDNFVGKQEPLIVPIDPSKFKKERRRPNEISSLELKESINKRKSAGLPTIEYEIEYYFKTSYAFSALMVCFAGLQFLYQSERTSSAIKGIILAFLTGGFYWVFVVLARTIASRGDVPAVLAAWLPNFLMLALIYLQLRKFQQA